MQEEYFFKCGALHGQQKWYYENGKLAKTIPYSYGYRSGVAKMYNQKGTLRQKVTFKNDSMLGEIEDFDTSGKLIEGPKIEKPNKTEGNAISEVGLHKGLPEWFLKAGILKGNILQNEYQLDNRMNPFYLEADFNGDGQLDLAIPIKQNKSQKVGFAIIHGGSHEVFIIAAGTRVKNGLSDNMNYIDL